MLTGRKVHVKPVSSLTSRKAVWLRSSLQFRRPFGRYSSFVVVFGLGRFVVWRGRRLRRLRFRRIGERRVGLWGIGMLTCRLSDESEEDVVSWRIVAIANRDVIDSEVSDLRRIRQTRERSRLDEN